jgi:1-acyl-sn-glycerol-3-phosphate acyltransferase
MSKKASNKGRPSPPWSKKEAEKRAAERPASAPPAPVVEASPEALPALTLPQTREAVLEEVHALEAELEDLGAKIHAEHQQRLESAPPPPPLTASPAPIPAPLPSMYDASKEVLSTNHFTRTWSRDALRSKVEDVDDMGFDRPFADRMAPTLDFLHDRWFRVENHGSESIPATGPCIFVANHSGTLPVDGLMLRVVLEKLSSKETPDFRWLAEDDVFHFPFVGSTLTRLGAVRACQENAERLLARGLRVGVFPEGLKGIGKLFRDRYQLQRFGRGGFVKLALRTGTPIVPVSILGGEETQPMLARLTFFAKLFDVPYVPVTPTFPLLGPAGLVPAPTKWKIFFGEPIDLSAHGAEAATDDLLVSQLSERVRSEIQGTLDRAVGERKSVFFG